ncbi:hypothetical protein COZ82_00235 [Candidatus Kaiserbacteria bacterium CG_4_8_14_3_um_filter_38_9]|uniref:Uncharacterized protein n=1 Tax=Candidatus Kaiserbacteria bacterium CG_4_8_14_3_um_filter_38_9 TaxID=1974599 RepID=A0A2M7IQ06_9BACT|nr:MAG: hypothetical protein COZ82_00235 [Candidatus Kaiserbacteria bacterium CG_4_8_14_3_um_filter_38_9]
MFLALLVTITSLTILFLLGYLFVIEEKIEHRLFLTQKRLLLDMEIMKFMAFVRHKTIFFGRYIIALSWYYSLHTLLKLVLRFLAGFYFGVEKILQRNRLRAKALRREKHQSVQVDSHLIQIAEHQLETALTEKEKTKIKNRALAGK